MAKKLNYLKVQTAPTKGTTKSFNKLIKDSSKIKYAINQNFCSLNLKLVFGKDVFSVVELKNKKKVLQNYAFFPINKDELEISIESVKVKDNGSAEQLKFQINGIINGKLNNSINDKLGHKTTGEIIKNNP